MADIYSYSSRRVGILDELRGAAIILVALYHLLYDLNFIFGQNIQWLFTPIGDCYRDGLVITLVMISGISCRFTQSNLIRGIRTLGLGLLITFLSWLLMPSQIILFGILHFFGSAMIIYHLLGRYLEILDPTFGFIAGIILFILTSPISSGYFGINKVFLIPLPELFYKQNWLFPLGLYGNSFFSADYYPLFPWIFIFFSGSFLGEFFRTGRMPDQVYRTHIPFLGLIGRHTLAIYLIHQPLFLMILYLMFKLIKLVQ